MPHWKNSNVPLPAVIAKMPALLPERGEAFAKGQAEAAAGGRSRIRAASDHLQEGGDQERRGVDRDRNRSREQLD